MDTVRDDDIGGHLGVCSPGQGLNTVYLPVVLQVGLTVQRLLRGHEGRNVGLAVGGAGCFHPAHDGVVAGVASPDSIKVHILL